MKKFVTFRTHRGAKKLVPRWNLRLAIGPVKRHSQVKITAKIIHNTEYPNYLYQSASYADQVPHNFRPESRLLGWILIRVTFLYFAKRSSHSLNHDFSIRQIRRKNRCNDGLLMCKYGFCGPSVFAISDGTDVGVFPWAEVGSQWTFGR